MSYREVSMLEIKEVLRRKEAGSSARRIARDMGLDRKTVGRYGYFVYLAMHEYSYKAAEITKESTLPPM